MPPEAIVCVGDTAGDMTEATAAGVRPEAALLVAVRRGQLAGPSDGLVVGWQVIGGRGADLDVLAAGAAFERAHPWDHIYEIPANRPLPMMPDVTISPR